MSNRDRVCVCIFPERYGLALFHGPHVYPVAAEVLVRRYHMPGVIAQNDDAISTGDELPWIEVYNLLVLGKSLEKLLNIGSAFNASRIRNIFDLWQMPLDVVVKRIHETRDVPFQEGVVDPFYDACVVSFAHLCLFFRPDDIGRTAYSSNVGTVKMVSGNGVGLYISFELIEDFLFGHLEPVEEGWRRDYY